MIETASSPTSVRKDQVNQLLSIEVPPSQSQPLLQNEKQVSVLREFYKGHPSKSYPCILPPQQLVEGSLKYFEEVCLSVPIFLNRKNHNTFNGEQKLK